MSYDLMVFEPSAVPSDRSAFMAWYKEQVRWTEDHGYEDPDVSTPQLRAWFLDMTREYPALNGPFATDDDDNPKASDYCIGRHLIYVGFAWSEAEDARETMLRFAAKHRVGFFDVSASEGELWMPSSSGSYVRIW